MPRPLSLIVLTTMLATLLSPLASSQQTTDEEKALRADFKSAMISKDPAERVAAVVAYSEGTRALEDGGTSRLVARTLADAMMDDDMSVARAAAVALSWGRDPATVIESYEKAFKSWRTMLGALATRPDEESRATYRGALDAYREGVEAIANYPDDRSVKVLDAELTRMRPGGVLENISGSLLGPITAAMLQLGSQSAVDAVVKSAATFPAATFGGTSDYERSRLGMSRSIHDSLSAFAVAHEQAPPEFDQNYQQNWAKWFKEHKKEFPSKLGKLVEPPPEPSGEMGEGRRGGGGDRPRRP